MDFESAMGSKEEEHLQLLGIDYQPEAPQNVEEIQDDLVLNSDLSMDTESSMESIEEHLQLLGIDYQPEAPQNMEERQDDLVSNSDLFMDNESSMESTEGENLQLQQNDYQQQQRDMEIIYEYLQEYGPSALVPTTSQPQNESNIFEGHLAPSEGVKSEEQPAAYGCGPPYPTQSASYSGTELRNNIAHPPSEGHTCPNQADQHFILEPDQERYNSDNVVQNGFNGQHRNVELSQHSMNTMPNNGWLPSHQQDAQQQQNMYQGQALGGNDNEMCPTGDADATQEIKSENLVPTTSQPQYESNNFEGPLSPRQGVKSQQQPAAYGCGPPYLTQSASYSRTELRKSIAHPPPEWPTCPNQANQKLIFGQGQKQNNSDNVVEHLQLQQNDYQQQQGVELIPEDLLDCQPTVFECEIPANAENLVPTTSQPHYKSNNFEGQPVPSQGVKSEQQPAAYGCGPPYPTQSASYSGTELRNNIAHPPSEGQTCPNQANQHFILGHDQEQYNSDNVVQNAFNGQHRNMQLSQHSMNTMPSNGWLPPRQQNAQKQQNVLQPQNMYREQALGGDGNDPANLPVSTHHPHPASSSDRKNRFIGPQSGEFGNQHPGNEAIRNGQTNRTSGGRLFISDEAYGGYLEVDLDRKVPMNLPNCSPSMPQRMNPNNYQVNPHISYGEPRMFPVNPPPMPTAMAAGAPTTSVKNTIVSHTTPMGNILNRVSRYDEANNYGNPRAFGSHRAIFHQSNNQLQPCNSQIQCETQTVDVRDGTAPIYSLSNHPGSSDIRNAYITNHPATPNNISININIDHSSGLAEANQNRSTINTVGPSGPKRANTGPSNTQEDPGDNGMNEQGDTAQLESPNLNGQFYCVICNKSFAKECYLKQHNRSHHGEEKLWRCSKCGKRFPCATSLNKHQVKHTGEKPYKCDLCPKGYVYKTDLKRHMALHTGNRPFICPYCNKEFIRNDQMKKHGETHNKKGG